MPNVRLRRLRSGMAKTPGSLRSLALRDGASYGYTFGEASGNLLDFVGANNLSVDPLVNRQIASPVGPGLLGMNVPGTNGTGAPAYGHIQGTRPAAAGGTTTYSYEAVVKYNSPAISTTLIDAEWSGVLEKFGLSEDGAGNMQGLIDPQNISFANIGALAGWHHYVWTNDATNSRAYLDGQLVTTTTVTAHTTDGAGTLSFGGTESSTTSNKNSSFGFFAAYYGTVLTLAQVQGHFAVSGCPA